MKNSLNDPYLSKNQHDAVRGIIGKPVSWDEPFVIDMNRVRQALPSRAYVQLRKKNSIPYIYIKIANPSMMEYGNEKQQEQDIEMIFDWLREIVGRKNVSEFYRHSTGSPWELWLKRNPYEFINLSDEDINGFVDMNLVKDGVLTA